MSGTTVVKPTPNGNGEHILQMQLQIKFVLSWDSLKESRQSWESVAFFIPFSVEGTALVFCLYK